MRNVGGISQTEAQKSSDLYMKCRYLDELTGGKGVVFATGTPISNSMVELYTMQKYLQYNLLKRNNLIHFDSWASTFGETVTAIELAPEGSGYRAKTRFAKFYNLPELMSLFRRCENLRFFNRSKETGTCLKAVYPFCACKGCYNLRSRIDAQTDGHCARRYLQDNDGFRNCKFIFNSIAAKHY